MRAEPSHPLSTFDQPRASANGRSAGGELKAFPDVAKIAAIVAVVIVHTCSIPNFDLAGLTGKTWFVTTVFEIFNRWCVPLFVMVSGMLLLQSKTAAESPGSFYRRRASRIAIPLIGWSIFYRFFANWTGPNPSFEENVQLLYGGVPYFHLYFLYLIAGLYLICPYLARAIDGLTQSQLAGLSIGALAFGFFVLGVPPWLPGTGANAFSMFLPFVGYFIAGAWLARVKIDRQLVVAGGAMFVLIGIAASLATYEFAHTSTRLEWAYLYNYATPTVIVMSVWVFIAIRYLCEAREARGPIRHMKALHYVGEATFGVFLIHPVFFTLWTQHGPHPIEASTLVWWVPLTVFGLIALAFACTIAMKRIPVLKRFV
jgi:surface polysaccharide O-acyltransferase-like enzyme